MAFADLPPVVRRRNYLHAVGAIVATGVAGCVGGRPRGPNGPSDGTPTDTPAGTPTGLSTSFSVTRTQCGTEVNRADVIYDDGGVTVDGTTWGNDACYTGRLESATLDDGTLTARISTERVEPEDASAACAQCITEIEYRLLVDVQPDEVVVIHDDERVATGLP